MPRLVHREAPRRGPRVRPRERLHAPPLAEVPQLDRPVRAPADAKPPGGVHRDAPNRARVALERARPAVLPSVPHTNQTRRAPSRHRVAARVHRKSVRGTRLALKHPRGQSSRRVPRGGGVVPPERRLRPSHRVDVPQKHLVRAQTRRSEFIRIRAGPRARRTPRSRFIIGRREPRDVILVPLDAAHAPVPRAPLAAVERPALDGAVGAPGKQRPRGGALARIPDGRQRVDPVRVALHRRHARRAAAFVALLGNVPRADGSVAAARVQLRVAVAAVESRGERQGVGAADVALVVLGRVEENRERARARRARRGAARRRARAEDRGPHLTEPVHSDDDGLLSKGDRGGLKNAEERKRRVQGERFGTRVVLGSSVLLQKRWQML